MRRENIQPTPTWIETLNALNGDELAFMNAKEKAKLTKTPQIFGVNGSSFVTSFDSKGVNITVPVLPELDRK